ncbi:MBOAT family O-acyltransferase [Desulfolucanica intricata]|uniref:MBOAT family O-acyltransferase n=1 Tax=Desulfolucanica intricata TaxID=1285191 RepID=UPI000835BF24|nr:MBOAT family O-acyltransferase [Desulfolucanica intricata]
MVFSSLLFIFVFLPAILCVYYLSPRFLKNFILVIGSLVFYAWGEPVYIVLMIFISVFDYLNGLIINKYQEKKIICRAVLTGSLVINLAVLGFFKYYGFLINNINSLFNLQLVVTDLPLPIGISFYTFQSISYVVDVYLGKVKAQKNIIHYATFVTMFPQLIAGPIIKYIDIAKQIENRKETIALFGEGAMLFIIGLSKKVLLANNIGIVWQNVKLAPMGEISVLSAWIGIIAFAFQIYFDFSGYSDMARGLAKMFGFDIMQNFNYPYISKSITEFWRRWHISLGSWFREYLYFPLGGNRAGRLKQYRNLFIVWFLTGFWHGASWNFVIWGLYFGLFVTMEKIFLLKWFEEKPVFIRHMYTLIVILVGWVFFEFENMLQGLSFIKIMFGFGANAFIDQTALYYLYTNALLLAALVVCSTPLTNNIVQKYQEKTKNAVAYPIPVIYTLLLFFCTAYLVNLSYNPFLYFRF